MDNIVAEEKNLFVDLEHQIMELWENEKYYEKLVEKNKGNKMFRFVQITDFPKALPFPRNNQWEQYHPKIQDTPLI